MPLKRWNTTKKFKSPLSNRKIFKKRGFVHVSCAYNSHLKSLTQVTKMKRQEYSDSFSIIAGGNNEYSLEMENIVQEVIERKPCLKVLGDAKTLSDYFRPLNEWKMDKSIFPFSDLYKSILQKNVTELYGADAGSAAIESLEVGFYINTAPHLSLPRGFDKANDLSAGNNNVNTLVFQSQVIQAAIDASAGRKTSLILATGKVSAQNINSAAYLQLADQDKKFRLISQKLESTPQIFLPAIDKGKISQLEDTVQKFSPYASEKQNKRVAAILDIFKSVSSSYVDQIAAANSYIYNDVLSGGNFSSTLTIETEGVEIDFLKRLLSQESSLIFRIFNNDALREKFISHFSGIQTGWEDGQSCFTYVSDKKITTASYTGDMSPAALKSEIEQGRIYPCNVLSLFSLMAEAGLLTVGGMNQVEYGTAIRDKAVSFLNDIGESKRAGRISQMPTDRAIVTPCFAVLRKKSGTLELSGYSDELCGRSSFNNLEPENILSISGRHSLELSILALYPFVTGKDIPAAYVSGVSQKITEMGATRFWFGKNRQRNADIQNNLT